MKETERRIERKKRICGALAAACLLAAALLLLLGGGRKAPVFAEFSASDALDGGADCYLNACRVLDRYAQESNRTKPAELLLVGYEDRDGTEVLLSLLVEPDEPLYETLSGFFDDGSGVTVQREVRGYFFCEPLKRYNRGALPAFLADAAAYTDWRQDADVFLNPVVLRFAGETEPAYEAACRAQNRGTWITVAVLAALSLACGVRLITLREKPSA